MQQLQKQLGKQQGGMVAPASQPKLKTLDDGAEPEQGVETIEDAPVQLPWPNQRSAAGHDPGW